MGESPKWLVYNGKSHLKGWVGSPPIYGNTHMSFRSAKRNKLLVPCQTWSKLKVSQASRWANVSQDIIISGGENISSLEVESIMMKHEKIAECAVVARRDPGLLTRGLRMKMMPVFFVTNRSWLNKHWFSIGCFKLPTAIHFTQLFKQQKKNIGSWNISPDSSSVWSGPWLSMNSNEFEAPKAGWEVGGNPCGLDRVPQWHGTHRWGLTLIQWSPWSHWMITTGLPRSTGHLQWSSWEEFELAGFRVLS